MNIFSSFDSKINIKSSKLLWSDSSGIYEPQTYGVILLLISKCTTIIAMPLISATLKQLQLGLDLVFLFEVGPPPFQEMGTQPSFGQLGQHLGVVDLCLLHKFKDCWPRLVVAVTISNCNLSSPRTIKMLKVKFKECVHCAE